MSSHSIPYIQPQFTGIQSREILNGRAQLGLTYDKLDVGDLINQARDPKAGAVVVFIGTTRDNFQGKSVETLEYSTYPALALSSLSTIATNIFQDYIDSLHKLVIFHRLGIVPIGEDSIVIVLSTSHRKEGWQAAERVLEEVKARVEIWKREWFVDGGVWRANRDGQCGEMIGS